MPIDWATASDEMIFAGERVLLDSLGTCDPGRLFNACTVAREIYTAMRALEPKAKAVSVVTLKLDTSDLERALNGFTAGVAEFKAAVEAATSEDDEPNRG